jgi:predicted ATPase with chaperone activity
MKVYTQILQACGSHAHLSKNYIEKTIQNILDRIDPISSVGDAEYSVEFIHDFYTQTIAALTSMANDRLLAKTNIKLGIACELTRKLNSGSLNKSIRVSRLSAPV